MRRIAERAGRCFRRERAAVGARRQHAGGDPQDDHEPGPARRARYPAQRRPVGDPGALGAQRGGRARHPLPPGPATAERWAEHLTRVGGAVGGRPVLVATDDPSSALVAEYRDRLEPLYRFPAPAEGLVDSLVDKRRLHDLCLETGVPTPDARFPQSSADLEEYAATGEFPVVVKRIGAPVAA